MAWTTKPSATAGSFLTGLDWEAAIDQVDTLTAPDWITYTPTWTGSTTNPSIGNGTLTGRYRRPTGSDLVHADIRIAMGSTTTYGSGFWMISLGVTPSTASQNAMVEVAAIIDASTGGTYPGAGRIFTGLLVVGTPSGGLVNPTTPMTWATSDELRISLFYEPAWGACRGCALD